MIGTRTDGPWTTSTPVIMSYVALKISITINQIPKSNKDLKIMTMKANLVMTTEFNLTLTEFLG